MVFEVIPFAVCTAAAGGLGAGGWHIAMGNKSDSWNTCGGRGKGYSMKPERSTEEIAQALYATDGTKNENIGAERAHTGLSPRLSHVFETMAGTQNRNPKPPPLPPPKQHHKTPFKPEVDSKGKRVVSVAEGLRMAFRHDNIGPPEGYPDYPAPIQPDYGPPPPALDTTYERYTGTGPSRRSTSPVIERRSLSPARVRRFSPDPAYGRRISPDARIEAVRYPSHPSPEAPPQPAWIQRVEVSRDLRPQAAAPRPSSVPQLSVSYFTPPAPKPLIGPFAQPEERLPPNASSHIFPSSNPRPRFPESTALSPPLDASSTYSSAAHSPAGTTRLSDSRYDRTYPSPSATRAPPSPPPVAPSPPPEYRRISAPAPAPSPGPSSAGIGISLVPDPQGNLRVASMVPGGAAMRSGKLSVGDIVTSVDGTEVQGRTVPEAIRLILGPHGSLVHLGVKSSPESRALRTVAIVRTASSYASGAMGGAPGEGGAVPPPSFTPSSRATVGGSFQGTRVL